MTPEEVKQRKKSIRATCKQYGGALTTTLHLNATMREAYETLQQLAQAVLDGEADKASEVAFHLVEVAIQVYGETVSWPGNPPPRPRRKTTPRNVIQMAARVA